MYPVDRFRWWNSNCCQHLSACYDNIVICIAVIALVLCLCQKHGYSYIVTILMFNVLLSMVFKSAYILFYWVINIYCSGDGLHNIIILLSVTISSNCTTVTYYYSRSYYFILKSFNFDSLFFFFFETYCNRLKLNMFID